MLCRYIISLKQKPQKFETEAQNTRFNNFFSTVAVPDLYFNLNTREDSLTGPVSAMVLSPVSEAEMARIVRELKPKKSGDQRDVACCHMAQHRTATFEYFRFMLVRQLGDRQIMDEDVTIKTQAACRRTAKVKTVTGALESPGKYSPIPPRQISLMWSSERCILKSSLTLILKKL
ncbi:hypothetical protein J6590_040917 [Homalodisca vitripennis]|nr:hypothetical protein J6590_040917 [Homalodisca vitripennis]